MTKSNTLRELFVTKVRALYDIEKQLTEALPAMAEAAASQDLKEAFREHLEETRVHVKRLEDTFDILKEEAKELECEGIRGIVKDAEWAIKNTEEGNALDTALIAAARYAEHYEMAGYMVAHEWAELLGESEIADLLEETFEEEESTDEKLSEIGTEMSENLSNKEDEE